MKRYQRAAQIFSTMLYNWYAYGFILGNIYQGRLKHFLCPGLNCYSCPAAVVSCPIGSIQLFAAYGTYHVSFYLLGMLSAIGALGGRIVCGWACPFGLVQDLLYKIPSPKRTLIRQLQYARYVCLFAVVLGVAYFTEEPWFCKFCPAGTLGAGIPLLSLNTELRLQIGTLFYVKAGLLAGFIAWMVVCKRPFCRTACPLGAIYSFFNKVSMLQLAVDDSKCVRCNACLKDCPMHIKIYDDGTASTQCIRCLRCTKCPSGAVRAHFSMQLFRKTIEKSSAAPAP
jgi:polyferredoxin